MPFRVDPPPGFVSMRDLPQGINEKFPWTDKWRDMPRAFPGKGIVEQAFVAPNVDIASKRLEKDAGTLIMEHTNQADQDICSSWKPNW